MSDIGIPDVAIFDVEVSEEGKGLSVEAKISEIFI